MTRNVSGPRGVKHDTTRPPARRSRRDAARRQVMTGIMRTLGTAIGEMTEPALEKISQEQAADPFQVLIGTMLSAQTRDPVTLAASMRLFNVARTPGTLARLPVRDIERLIYPVCFYRHKARHVKTACQQLMSRFRGSVPSTMDALLTLPGVGRKTANLVLILAHGSPDHICVDTHVHRISNRLGWVRTTTPEETEQALYHVADRRWWPSINRYLVTWGQNVCKPVYPLCNRCAISDACPQIGVTRVGKLAASWASGPRGSGRRGLQQWSP